jgi:hypothetical protein
MAEPIQSYWDLIEPVWDGINIYDGEASFLESIQPISSPFVLLYAAHFCQSEVCNGGFLQFFWNNTGVLFPEAIEGFKLIGMPQLASVLETAGTPLGSPYPRDREARWDALLATSRLEAGEIEQIFQKNPNLYLAYLKVTESLDWDTLNKQFYKLIESENGGFEVAADRYATDLASLGHH